MVIAGPIFRATPGLVLLGPGKLSQNVLWAGFQSQLMLCEQDFLLSRSGNIPVTSIDIPRIQVTDLSKILKMCFQVWFRCTLCDTSDEYLTFRITISTIWCDALKQKMYVITNKFWLLHKSTSVRKVILSTQVLFSQHLALLICVACFWFNMWRYQGPAPSVAFLSISATSRNHWIHLIGVST